LSTAADGPAAETGGRPATNAARHASAKSIVHMETVFSFTPRIGFGSGAATLVRCGAVARAAVMRERPLYVFLRELILGIALLHRPT
jgi:hypothetical protein